MAVLCVKKTVKNIKLKTKIIITKQIISLEAKETDKNNRKQYPENKVLQF